MSKLELEVEEPENRRQVGVRMSNYFANLLDRLQPSSEIVLIGTALIVGIGAGVGEVPVTIS